MNVIIYNYENFIFYILFQKKNVLRKRELDELCFIVVEFGSFLILMINQKYKRGLTHLKIEKKRDLLQFKFI